jgi:hypothetical protein
MTYELILGFILLPFFGYTIREQLEEQLDPTTGTPRP